MYWESHAVPSRGENDRTVSKVYSEWFLPSRMTHLQGMQFLKGHLDSADVSLSGGSVYEELQS